MKRTDLMIEIENKFQPRSAWGKGVKEYALDILGAIDIDDIVTKTDYCIHYHLDKILLNGASDWEEYSKGGCSLIYDEDIAKRLSTKSELLITNNGRKRPNHEEDWIDVQTRALIQASYLIYRVYKDSWNEDQIKAFYTIWG